jgi:hypothetical protein
MKLQTWHKLTNQGEFLTKQTLSEEPIEEIITVHAAFFKKSKKKQRQALRLLMWWAIKQYFKK